MLQSGTTFVTPTSSYPSEAERTVAQVLVACGVFVARHSASVATCAGGINVGSGRDTDSLMTAAAKHYRRATRLLPEAYPDSKKKADFESDDFLHLLPRHIRDALLQEE